MRASVRRPSRRCASCSSLNCLWVLTGLPHCAFLIPARARTHHSRPLRARLQRPSGRRPLRRRPAARPARLRREKQLRRHPRVHRKGVLDIVRVLNEEGIPTRNGGRWLKNTVHGMLTNESYAGTLVWGKRTKSKAPPVRVEGAVPAIVSQAEFERVQQLLKERAPKVVHPRRASSPYLLSGLVKCESCGRSLTAAEA